MPAQADAGRGWSGRDACGVAPANGCPTTACCTLAAIVYLSDFSTGFVDLDVDGLPRGGTSLDHTVYFHRPTRADDWLFMELEPVSAAGARGVYRGSMHDRAGTPARRRSCRRT